LNSNVSDLIRLVLDTSPAPIVDDILDKDYASIKLVFLCERRNCGRHSTVRQIVFRLVVTLNIPPGMDGVVHRNN